MCGWDSATRSRIVRQVRREDLDGDGAVQACVAGAVDLPHATGAGGANDLVGAEPCAGLESHRCGGLYAGWLWPRPERPAQTCGRSMG
jgi:hypothetical protein